MPGAAAFRWESRAGITKQIDVTGVGKEAESETSDLAQAQEKRLSQRTLVLHLIFPEKQSNERLREVSRVSQWQGWEQGARVWENGHYMLHLHQVLNDRNQSVPKRISSNLYQCKTA